MSENTLAGRRVVVTREHLEPLGGLLRERGAEPVHLPAIAVADPQDGGVDLARRLDRLDRFDWLVVSSPNGAERVGAVAARHDVRLAAVGSATAARLTVLAGREVDLVPAEQRAEGLAAALLAAIGGESLDILVAQADRAGPQLAEALRAGGQRVTTVTAYRTVANPPDLAPLLRDPADALLLASGSAARAWVGAVGALRQRRAASPDLDGDDPVTPPIVVAIGPSTADAARDAGLTVSAVAGDHSLAGLVASVESCVATGSGR